VLLVTVALCGCAANGTVTDFNRNTVSVLKMKIDGSGKLKIYDGNAVQEVGLKKIKSVMIENDITITYNGELYYRAEVSFKDGTTIGSLKDRSKKVYVAVDRYLVGESHEGNYRILLTNVSRLEIQ
jgi:uncharacterized protein (AIM24 family)